jgi:hypothetical protein
MSKSKAVRKPRETRRKRSKKMMMKKKMRKQDWKLKLRGSTRTSSRVKT